jgi:hypothetical protein
MPPGRSEYRSEGLEIAPEARTVDDSTCGVEGGLQSGYAIFYVFEDVVK